MTSKARLVLAAALFALVAGTIGYAVLADAREWTLLTAIERAEDRVSFDGVRRMTAGETEILLRIWTEEGRRRFEILDLKGPRREPRAPKAPRIPLFGGVPAVLRPAHGAWWRRVKDVELAVRNYDVAVTARETVAGRPADVVDLRAIRPGRASYRIWADVENRFPLRFQVLSNGEPVFETRFEEIAFRDGPPAPKRPEPWRPSWLRVTRDEGPAPGVAARAGFPVWLPSRAPAGFELRRAELWTITAGEEAEGRPRMDARVAHFTYTDGLAVLSMVEVSAGSALWNWVRRFLPAGGAAGDGKVVARKFVDRGGAAYLIELEGTVILVAGNVPPAEMEGMLRILRKT